MQNSTPLPPQKEFDAVAHLISRLKVAYRVFCSKKAIIIIDNEIDAFNTSPGEVMEICSNISFNLSPIVQDYKEDVMIQKLVANA